ncbi:ribonuclease P [Candidatus Woesearchaeota archaeon]|nr:ribonuclease P [Candidatus Woesearchaeota archaeon]
MKSRYKKKSSEQKKIAKERIEKLFRQAEEVFDEDKKLANRYVELARDIAKKYRVRIPSRLKRKFCKHCYSYLIPSVNVRVRTREGKVVYYCLECKKYMRFPYTKEQKEKRKK